MINTLKNIIKFMGSIPLFRPGLSIFLSCFITIIHRRLIRIYFNQIWLRKDGKFAVALGPMLTLKLYLIKNWQKDGIETIDVVAKWWFLHYTPQQGDIIVDVGAGMGEDTLLFSRLVGSGGKVYAIEAHPATFRCLSAVCKVNNLNNVTTEHMAAYSSNTTIIINNSDDDAWHENSIMLDSSSKGEEVKTMRIDDYVPLNNIVKIDFLKMNIEGAEVEALQGMPNTLKKTRHVCIACHDFLAHTSGQQMITRERCKQILVDAGFSVFGVDGNVENWQKDHIHGVRLL